MKKKVVLIILIVVTFIGCSSAASRETETIKTTRVTTTKPTSTKKEDTDTLKKLVAVFGDSFTIRQVGEDVLFDSKNNFLFDTNKYEIKPAMKAYFKPIAELMKQDNRMRFKITGHTDWVDTDEYNITLSKNRANALKEYLVSQGVPSSYITTDGKGEREPVATNTTAEGRAKNRRIEIKISTIAILKEIQNKTVIVEREVFLKQPGE